MKWLLALATVTSVCLQCGQTATVDQTETNVPYVGLVPSTLTHEGVMLPDPVPNAELGKLPELQVTLLTQYYQKWNLTSIDRIKDIVSSDDLTVKWDPPAGASCPTTLSVFVQATDPNAIIFYETNVAEESDAPLNMTSRVATSNRPYIQIQTPFRRYIDGTAIEPFTMRNMTLSLVAVSTYNQFWIRSRVYRLRYHIEGQARRNATGFLVPGIETDGWFIKFRMEMRSSLRAEAAIRQELADYDTTSVSPDPITGVSSNLRLHRKATGTYRNQLNLLHLTELDSALTGFDGGFPVNTSDHRQYGILVPHHNGKAFFGKVVRIDLKAMDNTSTCMESYRMESLLADGRINVTDIHGWEYHSGVDGQMRQGWFAGDGTPNNRSLAEAERKSHTTTGYGASHACITVLDLESLHKDARGFRKGFVGYPYAYLAAGDFSVVVRLNMENFSIATTVVIDLATVDVSLGGFSGGFTDGSWSCFNPYKTFAGPVGGIRSRIPADANRMYPYYNSRMTCINSTAWEMANHSDVKTLATHMITVDFSTIDQQLRGYSDALRVGRYAYFSPFKYSQEAYSGKFIRLYLGSVDIGMTIADLESFESRGIHDLVDILDLSRHDSRLRGYSGLFTVGNFIFLVPYRNMEMPANGQRGHGLVVRIDMNEISQQSEYLHINLGWRGDLDRTTALSVPATAVGWKGVTWLDLTNTQRTQVPNSSDPDLRGYYAGFGSGLYGYLVPFYNGVFSSKMSRFTAMASWDRPIEPAVVNLQELDFQEDRDRPRTYRGFQGGFASIWDSVH